MVLVDAAHIVALDETYHKILPDHDKRRFFRQFHTTLMRTKRADSEANTRDYNTAIAATKGLSGGASKC